MDVGVRELKQRLSEYLERAARGEVIRVTDRGRPKAVLGPIPSASLVEAGLEQGWIRPGDGSAIAPVTRVMGSCTVASALAEDRDE
jgi:prevent-host-death family protein